MVVIGIPRINQEKPKFELGFKHHSNQLAPAKAIALIGDTNPVYFTVQGTTQHCLRKQRRVVFLAQMRRDHVLKAAAVETCEKIC